MDELNNQQNPQNPTVPQWQRELPNYPNPYFIYPWFNYSNGFPRFQPWYDDRADFNTNARDYYNYLGNANWNEEMQNELINRLLKRNVKVSSHPCIKFTKTGDWIDNGTCSTTHPLPNNYDDIITLYCEVILSKYVATIDLYINVAKKVFNLPNAIECRADGLYAPDYESVIRAIDAWIKQADQKFDQIFNKLEDLQNQINNLSNRIDGAVNRITNLENSLQKIIDNLYASGAITSNDRNTFNFTTGMHIAYGNINHYGITQDGNYFIKTAKTSPNGSTVVGV